MYFITTGWISDEQKYWQRKSNFWQITFKDYFSFCNQSGWMKAKLCRHTFLSNTQYQKSFCLAKDPLFLFIYLLRNPKVRRSRRSEANTRWAVSGSQSKAWLVLGLPPLKCHNCPVNLLPWCCRTGPATWGRTFHPSTWLKCRLWTHSPHSCHGIDMSTPWVAHIGSCSNLAHFLNLWYARTLKVTGCQLQVFCVCNYSKLQSTKMPINPSFWVFKSSFELLGLIFRVFLVSFWGVCYQAG